MTMDNKVILFGSFTEDEAVQFASTPPKPVKKLITKQSPAKPTVPSSNGVKPNGPSLVEPATGSPLPSPLPSPRSQPTGPRRPTGPEPVVQPGEESKKSWAALIKSQYQDTPIPRQVKKPVRPAEGSGATKVSAKATDVCSTSFLPRGLVNTGNTCFLNSTLQALLSCTPFCDLLKNLKDQALSQETFPLLHAFANFAAEMENEESPMTENYYRKGDEEVRLQVVKDVAIGKPLLPSMFDPILQTFSPEQEGRQQDAQEFLSFMMNQMHEELIKLDGRGKDATLSVADEGEWETVGPKNRTAITRTYSFIVSPLSEIFGGQQDSFVRVKGAKISATSEPFYLLHLDISSEYVHSVEDALVNYVTPTTVEGYKSAGGKTEDAIKSMKLSSLPKVLILHLMRFSYGANGTWKLHKSIRYPPQLTLGRDLLKENFEGRTYELVATITHHGKEPSGGHYTADTKLDRKPENLWLRFDDRLVSRVALNKVLHDQAYVLFYRRLR